jgi:hypothetical protein
MLFMFGRQNINHKRQFKYFEKAKPEIMKWAKLNDIKLCEVYPVIPFVEDDFKAEIWIFYETSKMISDYADVGLTHRLEEEFLAILKSIGYPENYIPLLTFIYDSNENVRYNYGGSYYNRLR